MPTGVRVDELGHIIEADWDASVDQFMVFDPNDPSMAAAGTLKYLTAQELIDWNDLATNAYVDAEISSLATLLDQSNIAYKNAANTFTASQTFRDILFSAHDTYSIGEDAARPNKVWIGSGGIDSTGAINLTGSGAGATSITLGNAGRLTFGTNSKIYSLSDGSIYLTNNDSSSFSFISFGPPSSLQLQVWREANGTLALRNGTTAHALRVYNTYTDGSNYERGIISWSANIFTIGSQVSGTGTPRQVAITTSYTGTSPGISFSVPSPTSTPGVVGDFVNIEASLRIRNQATLYWNGKGRFYWPSAGNLTIVDNLTTGFSSICLGPDTDSNFTRLKIQPGVGLDIRTGDDTGYYDLRYRAAVLLPANNTTAITVSGSSLTDGNTQSLVNLSQTWNTTGSPTAFLVNITNTASGANAKLFDWQIGGDSLLSLSKTGVLTASGDILFSAHNTYSIGVDAARPNKIWVGTGGIDTIGGMRVAGNVMLDSTTANVLSIRYGDNSNWAIIHGRGFISQYTWGDVACGSGGYLRIGTRVYLASPSDGELYLGPSSTSGAAFSFIQWGNQGEAISTHPRLYRDGNHTLGQRNGTSAQTFRIYNTYTDASNYERFGINWSGNICTIGTEAAGTGTKRRLRIDAENVDFLNSVSATSPVYSFYLYRQSDSVYRRIGFQNATNGAIIFSEVLGSFTGSTDTLLLRTGGASGANYIRISNSGLINFVTSRTTNGGFFDFSATADLVGSPTIFLCNLTSTGIGSGPNTLLFDWQVSGVSLLSLTKNGLLTLAGSYQSANPSGGTARPWKFGSVVAGAVSLDTANYVEVEINGVAYKLLKAA